MSIVDVVLGEFCFNTIGTCCLYPHMGGQIKFSFYINPIAGISEHIKRK